MRDKKGKIKSEYNDVLESISLAIRDIVESLLDRGLTPEETIGLISGQATLCVGSQQVRRRIKNESN